MADSKWSGPWPRQQKAASLGSYVELLGCANQADALKDIWPLDRDNSSSPLMMLCMVSRIC